MQTNIIANAQVSKQLNGTTLYIVFEGTEQAIIDAYNTLWQCNALGTKTELEWLNAGQAIAVGTVEHFKRGLFNRALLRLMQDEAACKAAKGVKGGFTAQALAQAESQWNALPLVRVVLPDASIAPYFYKVQSTVNRGTEWECEKRDENIN